NATRDVTLTARTVNHPADPLSSTPVVIHVDTQPPTAPGALGFNVIDRRAGGVQISFTAPEDPTGQTVTGYQVRTSTSPIVTEGDGVAIAANVIGGLAPPGAVQTLQISGRRPGTTYYFGVRAVDPVGTAGPSAIGSVAVDFQVDTIESPLGT